MKRANGSGTVEYHRGRWRVRVVVDGKRRTIGTYDDEAKARRMLAAWLVEVDSGGLGLGGLRA